MPSLVPSLIYRSLSDNISCVDSFLHVVMLETSGLPLLAALFSAAPPLFSLAAAAGGSLFFCFRPIPTAVMTLPGPASLRLVPVALITVTASGPASFWFIMITVIATSSAVVCVVTLRGRCVRWPVAV